MKHTIKYKILTICTFVLTFSSCHKGPNTNFTADPNTGAVFSTPGDQVGRPGIVTIYVSDADKDNYKTTQPSQLRAAYQPKFLAQVQAYNQGAFTTNILGLSAPSFAALMATDVLTVALSGKTTYYDGVNVLTGRGLTDDVMDQNLKFLFGGPDGKQNPGLTSDHVSGNDKAFLTAFPYEAAPW